MKSLVGAYLERIPGDVFVKFQEAIKALVSKQHGVYALYKGDKLYYVGLAKNLKSRVERHLKDRHRKEWDSFSLYLIRHVEHLRELETLAIHISQPKGNTQSGRFARSSNLRPKLKRLLQDSIQTIFSNPRKSPDRKGRKLPIRKTGKGASLKGILPAGTTIKATYNGRSLEAQVDAEGKVLLNGKVFNSPSMAAMSVTVHAANGWRFWKYQDSNGKWVLLDTLRK